MVAGVERADLPECLLRECLAVAQIGTGRVELDHCEYLPFKAPFKDFGVGLSAAISGAGL